MFNMRLKDKIMIVISLLLIICSCVIYVIKEKEIENTYICESDIYFHSTLLNKDLNLSGNYGATIYPHKKSIAITLNGKASSDDATYILNRRLRFTYSLIKKGNEGVIQITQNGNDKAANDNTPDMLVNNFFSTPSSGRLMLSRRLNDKTMLIGPIFSPSIICVINKF